jgi:large subunit ribosomal protein L21
MHAVIKTGGRQIKVAVGDTFKIHKMPVDTGNEVAFDEVLLLTDGAGNVTIGQPLVKGAKVLAKVLSHGRGPKILIQKFRRRKHYDKIQGHRQDFTEIEILGINV